MSPRSWAGEAMVGAESKKDRLRLAAQDKEWLHVACHGWFNHEQPLASYLRTGDEERKRAGSERGLAFVSARLVTLSACQTGVSRGLPRG